MRLVEMLAAVAIAGGCAAGAIGFAGVAAAQPDSPYVPDYPTPAPAPPGADIGSPPDWAPAKPVDPSWAADNRQVWDQNFQHWGVWMNGVFIPTY
ncbi:hypothetical protein Mycch_2925 [Mycolicibacterium chubuense NBB4]|uniref:Lipoprotein n=1 Tax=Mycolicibacterium chubuense (strain NBB4) TaxID=710421 RepID=I4BK78_MYCCN|nr:hypothetical protein [Mycolicibacterium chubuense]AFM17685.1 hypothetical protein Mycch_2925 [Mycolicibacterium chubuense NBB4]